MRGTHITGAAILAPLSPTEELRPAAWVHKPARLARMDRLCGLALVCVDAALAHAGFDAQTVTGWSGERVAVVFGTSYGCHATDEEFFRGLVAEGARGASPRLFAYTLPSSPLGEITIHYGARGPALALASGDGAGLEAVARAVALVAEGRADIAIAAAAEVGFASAALHDGAAAIVVEREGRRAGAAVVSRGHLIGEGAAFLDGQPSLAALRADSIALAATWDRVSELRAAPGTPGAAAPLAALVRWLLDGKGHRALATAQDPAGSAHALYLIR